MARHLSTRDLDWTLLLIVLLVCGFGVLQIYSATIDTPYHGAWWKQIIYIGGGLILMWGMLKTDYHSLMHNVNIMYAV